MFKEKIGVIGCGIFGATIALELHKNGYDVIVFEKNDTILKGASLNNQNRLHLGFHYPRDDETARQCVAGFQKFIDKFPSCIADHFPNSYYIAKEGSNVTPSQYLDFCNRLGLEYELIDEKSKLVNVENVDLGISCNERVYDSRLLSELIRNMLYSSKINLNLKNEVSKVTYSNKKFKINISNGSVHEVDQLINCSYADINRVTNQLGYEVKENQYEYTVVPIVETNLPKVGITIMDGRFMTLLPYGKTKQSLLYHVDNTVISRETANQLNIDWLSDSKNPFVDLNKDIFYRKMIDLCTKYIPELSDSVLKGFLHGPRMVLAKSDDTDARPSIIQSYPEGYHTVFSGKIDHSVWISEEIASRVMS